MSNKFNDTQFLIFTRKSKYSKEACTRALVLSLTVPNAPASALRKKKSQNGSPRRAIWLSVTQLSLELHFGATIHRRAVPQT